VFVFCVVWVYFYIFVWCVCVYFIRIRFLCAKNLLISILGYIQEKEREKKTYAKVFTQRSETPIRINFEIEKKK
jgi:hypothetical protein